MKIPVYKRIKKVNYLETFSNLKALPYYHCGSLHSRVVYFSRFNAISARLQLLGFAGGVDRIPGPHTPFWAAHHIESNVP